MGLVRSYLTDSVGNITKQPHNCLEMLIQMQLNSGARKDVLRAFKRNLFSATVKEEVHKRKNDFRQFK